MYGLVNRAIEELICSRFGEAVWETVKGQAGLDVAAFVSLEPYPDEVTYQLAHAASHVLKLPLETVLKNLGEYWTLYTAKEGYGDLLKMSGHKLPEFLMNLDNLHARVGLLYPHLQPPSFQCTEVTEHGMLLHYHSHRTGMASLVVGLLQGLGKMFAVELEIEHIAKRGEETGHDIFKLTYLQGNRLG